MGLLGSVSGWDGVWDCVCCLKYPGFEVLFFFSIFFSTVIMLSLDFGSCLILYDTFEIPVSWQFVCLFWAALAVFVLFIALGLFYLFSYRTLGLFSDSVAQISYISFFFFFLPIR